MVLYRILTNDRLICVTDQLDVALFALNALVSAGVSGLVFQEAINDA